MISSAPRFRTPRARGPDEREIVTAAAARGVEVILRHRRDCARLTELRDRLLLRLDGMEQSAVDMRGCAQYADTFESATRITERLLNAERRLFNLDQNKSLERGSDDNVARHDQHTRELLIRLRSDQTGAAALASLVDASELCTA